MVAPRKITPPQGKQTSASPGQAMTPSSSEAIRTPQAQIPPIEVRIAKMRAEARRTELFVLIGVLILIGGLAAMVILK